MIDCPISQTRVLGTILKLRVNMDNKRSLTPHNIIANKVRMAYLSE